jgi:hypothetical protein
MTCLQQNWAVLREKTNQAFAAQHWTLRPEHALLFRNSSLLGNIDLQIPRVFLDANKKCAGNTSTTVTFLTSLFYPPSPM